MPWITDANGERSYKISAYVKEELPTWSEFYEDWYKNSIWRWDLNTTGILDPYWKIPRQLYLMTIACNQLNKMIFEDGYQAKLLDFISKEIFPNAEDVRFTCQPIPSYDPNDSSKVFEEKLAKEMNDRYVGLPTSLPPIYTIPHPDGFPNPFIINKDARRIKVTDLGEIEIHPIIQFNRSENGKYVYCPMMSHEPQAADCKKIIDFLMRPIQNYFEGEGVGWKNEEGMLIDNEPSSRNCAGVGADPAL